MRLGRTLKIVLALALVMTLIAGCGGGQPADQDDEQSQGSDKAAGDKMRVAMVFAVGGLGDKSFNDSAYEGLKRAEAELGVEFDYVEPRSIAELEGYQRNLAKTKKYDLILMLAHYQADALKKVSAEFPEQKFVIQDTIVEAPNVASYMFKDHEKTFLIGALVGQLIKTDLPKLNGSNKVGVVGGMDVPVIRSFVSGYMAGVKYVNPEAEVLVSYVGDFGNPAKGKETALAMYDRGADIVYHAAGGTGLGVFEAAKDVDRYAVGVDIDQTVIDPEHIVASSVRKLDQLIFDIIKDYQETGQFEPGAHYHGLKENALEYKVSEAVDIDPAIIENVEELREKIISGELVIPDKVEDVDEFLSQNKQ